MPVEIGLTGSFIVVSNQKLLFLIHRFVVWVQLDLPVG